MKPLMNEILYAELRHNPSKVIRSAEKCQLRGIKVLNPISTDGSIFDFSPEHGCLSFIHWQASVWTVRGFHLRKKGLINPYAPEYALNMLSFLFPQL